MVLSIDEVNDLLDTMAEEFPEALFDGLNGGVNLLEEAVPDTEFPAGEMYILGGILSGPAGQLHQPVLRLLRRPGGKGRLGPPGLGGRAVHHLFP